MAANEDARGVEATTSAGETDTDSQEGTIMNDVTTTTDSAATPIVRPIYGPSDPRWGELAAWMAENADPEKATIEDMMPLERAGWHSLRILGARINAYDLDYIKVPAFPEGTPQPAWATVVDVGDFHTDTELPIRLAYRELVAGAMPARIVQESTFDPETGAVMSDPVKLSVWITGNEPLEVTDPEKAREVGRLLLSLADEFERIV